MKKKVGLYFGTFNPIHIGHLAIANHLAEFSDLEEIWFVITPHSPFKKKSTLLADNHRYQLVQIATDDYPKLKPSTIEFDLPQPNYTINTLVHLAENYPQHQFNLIMGEDNLVSFHKWKNYEVILEGYSIYVYPRIYKDKKPETQFDNHPKIHKVDAPIMEISSTFIRKAIADKKNIQPLLPCKVWQYVDEMNFYKK
ncbi:nicotinate (nicotinamide) nucleotide adenylyltransferase [Aureibaculum sp. 2210JD6-5]|uniref:nicotinate (nicotinamide) nucleotide adenylyltransferase n=1 Tax=Aureibaculum sp. 2210JD6-5 TaxID=3103957 RepID=UPI002AAC989E|nr:nicotinate (nicotinamide) nucleotide adenylyltransferase [Aureibaculum sp. 2210JD6-5]MDY7396169.1 nicotinate (nicotinamide) nucleotide adenylyltransferase [Aureibaculum sp. 2210JD6-5]